MPETRIRADIIFEAVDLPKVEFDKLKARIMEIADEYKATVTINGRMYPAETAPQQVDRAARLDEAARAIEEWQHERDDEVNDRLGALDTRTEIEHRVIHRAADYLRRLADGA